MTAYTSFDGKQVDVSGDLVDKFRVGQIVFTRWNADRRRLDIDRHKIVWLTLIRGPLLSEPDTTCWTPINPIATSTFDKQANIHTMTFNVEDNEPWCSGRIYVLFYSKMWHIFQNNSQVIANYIAFWLHFGSSFVGLKLSATSKKFLREINTFALSKDVFY